MTREQLNKQMLDNINNNATSNDLFLASLTVYIYRTKDLNNEELMFFYKKLNDRKFDGEYNSDIDNIKAGIINRIWNNDKSFTNIFNNDIFKDDVNIVVYWCDQLLKQYTKDHMMTSIKNIDMFLEDLLKYSIKNKLIQIIKDTFTIMYQRNKYTSNELVSQLINDRMKKLDSKEDFTMLITLINVKNNNAAFFMNEKNNEQYLEILNSVTPTLDKALSVLENFKTEDKSWLLKTTDTLLFFKERNEQTINTILKHK